MAEPLISGAARIGLACCICGAEFWIEAKAGRRRNTCSLACSQQRQKHLKREYKVRTSQGIRLNTYPAGTKKPKPDVRFTCESCGQSAVAGFSPLGNKFCSGACRIEANERRRQLERRAQYPAAPCKGCRASFQPRRAGALYCSNDCRSRADDAIRGPQRRKATREPIDPFAVFDRDGWRCQLCGVATPKRLRGSYEPLAPELDHIVPLSKGGQHTYRNTQCACRRCNIAKGAKPQGQMRLLG